MKAVAEIRQNTILTSLTPHMHVRGKDMTYTAFYPDGTSEVLLSVPHHDFNWQITYELATPKRLPKGTTVEVVAHYDNSPANQHNPDPTKDVSWGDQTWERDDDRFLGFGRRPARSVSTGPVNTTPYPRSPCSSRPNLEVSWTRGLPVK